MRFIVVVAVYNMAPWIERNIASIKGQNHGNFRCLIGDDLSTDDSLSKARGCVQGDGRFKVVAHREKRFSLGNIRTLIGLSGPDDEDVIVLVDGDDYLAHPDVLQRLEQIYREQDCWITYGSYARPDMSRDGICMPYSQTTIRSRSFRKAPWRASHLKTFKYKLWKRIPEQALTITPDEFNNALRRALLTLCWRSWWHWRRIDPASLVSPCGSYVRRCDDKAFMLSMLELAGGKAHFIDEIMYIYNAYRKELDFGRMRIDQKWYTRLIRYILRCKPPLQPLEYPGRRQEPAGEGAIA